MELKFKNSSIEKYKSNSKAFINKKGKSKPIFISFKMPLVKSIIGDGNFKEKRNIAKRGPTHHT